MQLSLIKMGIGARATQVQPNESSKDISGAPAGAGPNNKTTTGKSKLPQTHVHWLQGSGAAHGSLCSATSGHLQR